MKEAVKFAIKAFFGGCIGCLGALSFVLVLLLILGLVFGPKIAGNITSLLQSLPTLFSQGLSSLPFGATGTNPSTNPSNITPMEIFLTLGTNSDAKHITTFSAKQASQITFWVQAPQGASISFTLLLTLADGSQTQFGPTFKTATSGAALSCGHFSSQTPQVGSYKVMVIPDGSPSSAPAGSLDFKVTS